jgi:hypothetical protein
MLYVMTITLFVLTLLHTREYLILNALIMNYELRIINNENNSVFLHFCEYPTHKTFLMEK